MTNSQDGAPDGAAGSVIGSAIDSSIDKPVESARQVPPKKVGLARLWAATLYSADGLRACFRSEEAFRIESILALVLAPVAFLLGKSPLEVAVLLFALVLVLLVELLNSAIEAVVDRVGLEYHALSKVAKDIGSAAVLISLLFFVVVWALLLL